MAPQAPTAGSNVKLSFPARPAPAPIPSNVRGRLVRLLHGAMGRAATQSEGTSCRRMSPSIPKSISAPPAVISFCRPASMSSRPASRTEIARQVVECCASDLPCPTARQRAATLMSRSTDLALTFFRGPSTGPPEIAALPNGRRLHSVYFGDHRDAPSSSLMQPACSPSVFALHLPDPADHSRPRGPAVSPQRIALGDRPHTDFAVAASLASVASNWAIRQIAMAEPSPSS